MRSPLRLHEMAAFFLASGGIFIFGCNLVLGVDKFSAEGCPALGARKCDGDTLQICAPNGEWRLEKKCTMSCTPEGCIDCDPGVVQCDRAINSVLTCQPNRQWRVTECVNQTCLVDQCVGTCAPGKRCAGDVTIEFCIDGKWNANGSCSPDKPCLNGECYECKNGDLRCDNQTVQTCSASQWQSGTDCNAVDRACIDGKCVGECAPNRRQCLGSIAQTCDASGHWQGVDCAEQYRVCNELTGECSGECVPTTSPVCNGNVVKSCDASGHWAYDDCGPAGTCLAGACTTKCGPASARCEGNMAEACGPVGEWTTISTCANGCIDGTCVRSTCDCGPNQGMACCASPYVPGGTFYRGNANSAKATVGAFRIDAYEITVGRFRKFVADYDPTFFKDGVGTNPRVLGSGWKTAWNAYLPTDAAALKMNLACHASSTWTNAIGDNEGRPLNCLSWYEAFAFCIWDRGFLPTEAEWNFAAAGGVEQREFPWSVPATNTTIDLDHAVFQCLQAGAFDYNDCFLGQLPLAGSRSPAGDGKYGHKDLAGSLFEWTLDVHGKAYPGGNDCHDCADLDEFMDVTRVLRGGGWNSTGSMLYSHARAQWKPTERQWFIGARCARGL